VPNSSVENFPFLARLFHQVALGSTVVGEALFDLESALYAKKLSAGHGPSVFVCGLARAGTTIMLRALYDTGAFASLTYHDMPMVLAPNLWKSVVRGNQKEIAQRERAHGDGILVDFDSPEALEEVFWRVQCGEDYISDETLSAHAVTPAVQAKFSTYQGLIRLRHGKARYLSKNNNNLLRLDSLARQNADARFLVPFRDPATQAASLLAQHLRFTNGPAFQKKYMAWLAHHEFGATLKAVRFADGGASGLAPTNINYWLDLWVRSYRSVLDLMPAPAANVSPVNYERLCIDPAYWRTICRFTEISEDTPARFRKSDTAALPGLDPTVLKAAQEIYAELDAASWV
jgi:hypothetical protein